MPSSLRTILLLALSVLVWMAGVVWSIYGMPLWMDEGVTLLQISGQFVRSDIEGFQSGAVFAGMLEGHTDPLRLSLALAKMDVHPPAHYLLALGWTQIFGHGTEGLRFLSTALVGAGMLALLVAPSTLSTKGRLLALGMALLATPVLFAAGNIRSYGLAVGALAGCLALLQWAMYRKDAGATTAPLLGALALAIVAAMSHYFTALVTGPALIYALTQVSTSHKARLAALAMAIPSALILVFFLSEQMASRPDQYAGFKGWGTEIQGTFSFLMGSFSWTDNGGWPLLLSWTAGAIGILGLFLQARSPYARLHLVSLVGFVFGLVLLFAATDKTVAGSTIRYFSFACPALAIGFAYAADRLWERSQALAAILPALVLAQPFWAMPAGPSVVPWGVPEDVAQFNTALEHIRAHDGVVVIPSNIWRGAHFFSLMDARDQASVNGSIEGIQNALDEAVTRSSFLLLPAPSWDPDLDAFLASYHDAFLQCGFSQRTPLLWIRDDNREGPCVLAHGESTSNAPDGSTP